jgi:uncharacterized surface protein with fasciclin (FAS1) repeats
MSNIIETAIAAGSFKTLVSAIQAAGLAETLSGKGPFTVFAPNEDAFAKLPAGTLDGLLKDIPKLKQLLSYHVVPGKQMAADIMKLTTLKTVEGQNLAVTSTNGVRVNNASVIKADVGCDNGVIHVVDTVFAIPASKFTTK